MRRAGKMIAEQARTVGLNQGAALGGNKESSRGIYTEPRDTRPTLASVGISKKLSSRAQAIAAIPDHEFEETLAEHQEAQKAVTTNTMDTLARKGAVHVSHNSGNHEWYTPKEYIDAAVESEDGLMKHAWPALFRPHYLPLPLCVKRYRHDTDARELVNVLGAQKAMAEALGLLYRPLMLRCWQYGPETELDARLRRLIRC